MRLYFGINIALEKWDELGNVFTIPREEECYTKNNSIAMNLNQILVNNPGPNDLRKLIWSCDSPKLKLIWEILFETGMDEVELLEERVYQYGGMIKEQDYISREIFLGLISLVENMKKINR